MYFMEDLFQHLHDELHGGVVVVEQHHFEERGAAGFDLGLGDYKITKRRACHRHLMSGICGVHAHITHGTLNNALNEGYKPVYFIYNFIKCQVALLYINKWLIFKINFPCPGRGRKN
jgi:hypothetical protein